MATRSLTTLCSGLAVAALLAACDRGAPDQPPQARPSAEIVQPQPPVPAEPALTAYGWGNLTIGMAEAEAVRLAGLTAPDQGPPLDNHEQCHELLLPAQPGLYVMIQEGVVSRITLSEPGPIRTDRGLGVGAREADVIKAYGEGLEVTPHKYEDEPAHYLTFWTLPGKRGVRYETDRQGVVTTIHAGDDSIQLVEGCA